MLPVLRKSLLAQKSCELGPVPHAVKQSMNKDFTRARAKRSGAARWECQYFLPICVFGLLDEGSKVFLCLVSNCKELEKIIGRDLVIFCDLLAQEPL